MEIQIRPKLAEEIADYLAEKIIQMQIRPGDRITEASIREVFDVSGSPVREALMILERKHLVELIPRRGARATEMPPEFIINLYDVMTELGGLLIRRVCENHTEEELSWFMKMASQALDCARNKDVHGYFEAIRIIVLGVVEISRNPLIAGFIREWIPSFQRANFLYLSQSSFNFEDHVKTFQEISKQVVDGNDEMAERTARSFFGREKERVLEIVRKYSSEWEKAAG